MGDEFRCFLVALFAWYVGPLACKGIVSLSKQDFEWMSWILNGSRPWRQLLRVILTLDDFTHPEFCARFAQGSRKLKAIHSLEAFRDYTAGKIGTALIGA